MERLWHYVRGYLKIRLRGYSPERFLNLCSARGIEIWGIVCAPSGDYEFYMTLDGYRNVRPLVKKAHVRLHIMKRFGLPFFLQKYRNRWYFAVGTGAFFLILYVMSLFIWDIQVEGNYHYTYDTLLKYLNGQDIACGMIKSKVDCDKLEESLRGAFPEITWVSARVSGTKLLIQLKENEVLFSVPEKNDFPCDIVASKAGVITSMVVRAGTAQVKVGDNVEAGQVLVKGQVPITGENDEEIKVYPVHADADILARTQTGYEKEIPSVRNVSVPTGRKRYGFSVKAGRFSFTAIMPVWEKNGEWNYAVEEKKLHLFSGVYLPCYFGKITGYEMESYEKGYTKKELENVRKAFNRSFVEKLEEKGVHILENNDRIERNASGYRFTGTLATEESIVKLRKVSQTTTDSQEREAAQ